MKATFSAKRLTAAALVFALAAIVIIRVVQASGTQEVPPDVDRIRAATGVPVEVVTVRSAPLEVRRSFTGAVRGVRGATVRAGTADEILDIPVRVGQRVAAGDVVVRQSSRGSRASVSQAEAAHEQASRSVERLRSLHERGAVSDQDWDNALTALRMAEANLEAARKSVVLTSPIAGTVTDVLVTQGSVPSSGDPLVRVSDLSRLQVLLQVSPEQRGELAMGQRAWVAGVEGDGEVTRIALQADPDTRLVEVEVTLPGGGVAAGGIMPGGLATVEIVVGTRERALTVPLAALRDDSIWVVDAEGVAHLRPVRTGLRGRSEVELLEGVAEGERIVTAGASLLSEGVLTRIVGI